MNRDDDVSEKDFLLARVIMSSLLFVAIIAFACMEAVVVEVFFRFGHNELKDFVFLVVLTLLILSVSLMIGRMIAKLLPSTAGLPLFQHKATMCGHMTYRKGRVSAFEQSITTKMPKNEDGCVNYCLDRLGKMAVLCAWCGKPIFIGDPVTLYTPDAKHEMGSHVVVHKENPLQLVGCLRWACAHTGADIAGVWIPGENGKGRVKRIQTPYEQITGVDATSSQLQYPR